MRECGDDPERAIDRLLQQQAHTPPEAAYSGWGRLPAFTPLTYRRAIWTASPDKIGDLVAFHITGLAEADAILDEEPFAIVVAMLLDQQYPMEHAFRGPFKIKQRFGTLDPEAIADADPEAFVAMATQPPAIHRYGRAMAARVQELARVVVHTYDGDANQIWATATSGADLLRRVKALPGFGDQKAKIFVALLAKQLGIQPDGWESAAGDYALPGYRSVADVTSPETLQKVRDFKRAKKAAATAAT